METFGNEVRIQQGEDWNLDVLLSSNSQEYIPFIVSNQRKNPFFVVTVASTKYEKNLRYVASWWNDLSGNAASGQEPIPTFYQTVPQWYQEVASINDLPSLPPIIDTTTNARETANTRLLYQYTLSTDSIDPETGHKPYYYFYFDYNEAGTVVSRVDYYECRIRFNFRSVETANWVSQNYLYQITLVSGDLMAKVLNDIALAHGMPEDWPTAIAAQYNYVKVQWPTALQPDIDVTSPLGRIETPQVILSPTKLEVSNNLRKLI